jgi:hypothetical protein
MKNLLLVQHRKDLSQPSPPVQTTRYCGVVVEGVVGVVVGVVGEVLPPNPGLALPEADPSPVELVVAGPPPNKLALAFICSIRGS